MATIQTLPRQTMISLDEYLRTSYHPDCDFVDGHLEPRRPGEDDIYTSEQIEALIMGEFPHNRLQASIASWFIVHETKWPISTVTEQRIRVAATRVRICDVCVLRDDVPTEPVTITPPLLCIEILSPEDRIPRASVVLEDYRRMGVPNIWLIDPIKRTAYTFDSTGLHQVGADRLELPNSPIHLILSDLFAALD